MKLKEAIVAVILLTAYVLAMFYGAIYFTYMMITR